MSFDSVRAQTRADSHPSDASAQLWREASSGDHRDYPQPSRTVQPGEHVDFSTDPRTLPELALVDAAGARRFEARFDANGQLERFTDNRGETFTRDGDHFVDTNNPIRRDGVNISVNRETGTAEIVDRATGIRTELQQNGTETVDYSAVGGGRVTRRATTSHEYISIESVNRPMRMLILSRNEDGARVSQYSDGRMNSYTFNNRFDDAGHPLYDGINGQGQPIGSNFTVTADRSGNVVIRNQDRPDAPDYAVREYNNGTVVMSNSDNSVRTVTDSQGRSLQPNSEEARAAERSPILQQVPPSANIDGALLEASRNFVGSGLLTNWVALNNWFRPAVQNNGRWDFKRTGEGNNVVNREFEDYANWHYGYIGTGAGIDPTFLQERAGANQIESGTSRPEWGSPSTDGGVTGIFSGTAPYGDDPRDNEMIRRGIDDRNRDIAREQENARRVLAS